MPHSVIQDLERSSKSTSSLLIAHWEITDACNLSCRHCFSLKSGRFYDYKKALKLISKLEDLEILNIGLTGGEALLHPHFADIYCSLKRRGFLVTVFTNGTLINNSIIKLFSELPPRKLKISLYGSDSETFERVTQRSIFADFEKALSLLEESHVRYEFQIPLMRSNLSSIDKIEGYCRQRNVRHKIGTLICPMLNGCKDNLTERLSACEVVKYEGRDTRSFSEWAAEYNGNHVGNAHLSCNDASNFVVINIDGSLSVCGLLRKHCACFDEDTSAFEMLNKIRSLRQELKNIFTESPCATCRLYQLCRGCPAFSFLETGKYGECAEYLRGIALAKVSQLNELGLVPDSPRPSSCRGV